MNDKPQSSFEFGAFRLDPVTRVLHWNQTRVPLTPRAFDTLYELVRLEGRIISRRRLLSRLWPGAVVSEATLTQNVYTVRRTLRAAAGEGTFIETVPNVGYRFVPAVKCVPLTVTQKVEREIRSMAVLPFVSLTQDEEHRFLGLGLADALIVRLSGLRDPIVRPTSAILRYAGESLDPLRAARELRVDVVIQGTLQKSGRRIRLNVQLVEVHQAATLWAEAFESSAEDLFTLQDRISERIASALRAELNADRLDAAGRAYSTDTATQQAYVRGRFFWNQRTAASLERAIACFDEALARTPDFARAYSGRADARSLLPIYSDAEPDTVFPSARDDARRALELDERSAEAQASLAHIQLFYDWSWEQAEAGFRRAIELDPSYATAYHWFGFLLSATARHDEAIAMLERAAALDPSSLPINVDWGLTLYFARRHAEAIASLRRTIELDERFAYARFGLALALVAHGDLNPAIEQARAAVTLSGEGSMMLALLGHVLARAGQTGEALETLHRLGSVGTDAHASRTAMVRAAMDGEERNAIADLIRAAGARSRYAVFLGVWPVFDRIRPDPDFAALVQRIGHPGSGLTLLHSRPHKP